MTDIWDFIPHDPDDPTQWRTATPDEAAVMAASQPDHEGVRVMTLNLGQILDRAGVATLGVLDTEIDVPILAGAQRQGDVLILPRPNKAAATTAIPAAGVTVVRAETSTANTHSLLSWDGQCFFDAEATGGASGLALGTLTVPDGASAYLVHTEEHGANGIAPGTYELRRQREFAGEWQRVAD